MNVFLGVFRPEASRPAIWEKEYNSDYYLHHQVLCWGSVTSVVDPNPVGSGMNLIPNFSVKT
jgi:hypothetical protein